MKRIVRNIDICVILYLVMYGLPIFPFRMRNIVGAALLIYICIATLRNGECIKWKPFIVVASMIGIEIVYLLIVATCNGNSLSVISFMLYWILGFLPVSMFVARETERRGLSLNEMLDMLLFNANIQGMLALIGYLFRDIQRLLNQYMVAAGAYSADVVSKTQGYRMFGLSEELFFAETILQMFLSMIAIYMGLFRKKRYIMYAILPALSAIINARVALVVAAIGMMLITIKAFEGKAVQIKRRLLMLGVLCVMALLVLIYSNNGFIRDGIEQILGLFGQNANKQSSLNILMNQMIVLPPEENWLCGLGTRIMGGSKYGVYSDIGYINDLWMGGFVYILIVYSMFGYMLAHIVRLRSADSEIVRFMVIFLIVVLAVCNIKSQILGPNMFVELLFVLFGMVNSRNVVAGNEEEVVEYGKEHSVRCGNL